MEIIKGFMRGSHEVRLLSSGNLLIPSREIGSILPRYTRLEARTSKVISKRVRGGGQRCSGVFQASLRFLSFGPLNPVNPGPLSP